MGFGDLLGASHHQPPRCRPWTWVPLPHPNLWKPLTKAGARSASSTRRAPTAARVASPTLTPAMETQGNPRHSRSRPTLGEAGAPPPTAARPRLLVQSPPPNSALHPLAPPPGAHVTLEGNTGDFSQLERNIFPHPHEIRTDSLAAVQMSAENQLTTRREFCCPSF